jgi:hypothetical protein
VAPAEFIARRVADVEEGSFQAHAEQESLGEPELFHESVAQLVAGWDGDPGAVDRD